MNPLLNSRTRKLVIGFCPTGTLPVAGTRTSYWACRSQRSDNRHPPGKPRVLLKGNANGPNCFIQNCRTESLVRDKKCMIDLPSGQPDFELWQNSSRKRSHPQMQTWLRKTKAQFC